MSALFQNYLKLSCSNVYSLWSCVDLPRQLRTCHRVTNDTHSGETGSAINKQHVETQKPEIKEY